ncbi:MAG: SpoIID/LytB domain-containing protein [Candidatus Omnitrophica bacterium]|nr:SpoIID/LytB domain-containing protein [Candidatus Omnitrophota bacterium]
MVSKIERILGWVTGIFLSAAILFGVFVRCVYADEPQYIRAAVLQDAPSFSLRIKGPYEIQEPDSKKIISRGRGLNVTVCSGQEGIVLGNFKANSNSILINVTAPAELIINGRRFRDNIRIYKRPDARLVVINIVNLEDYIRGILYHEASHYWPQEALRAQAIVCRTYALYEMQENNLRDFDVTSDIYSQVYGGLTSERQRTNAAVEDTRGCVLTYQGKIFPAFFSATCGGHTEDASVLWKIELPPLKGVPCDFCKESPHYNWHYVLSKQEFLKEFASAGYKIGGIMAIFPAGKDASGRVTDLKISSLTEEINISAKDFRNIIGPNLIRSTNFEVSVVHSDVVFEGVGWGHGVGLCQWGAYFMAKSGHTYIDILRHYYPGAEVTLMQ